MTAEDKKRIIAELCESLKARMEAALPRMPEDWDGNELRLYASDIMLDHATRVSLGIKRRYQQVAAERGIF